ncbi:MAG: PAS domain S-box protein, partial [Planctomycetota bacterium]
MRVHTEYMDSKHFSDKAHYANLYTLLKNKARRRQHDVIITVDNNALLFLLEYRNELYPNVPIVFCAVDRYHDSMYEVRPAKTTINKILAGHESVTGVLEEFDHEATIEIALYLHPFARRVILINDGVNKVTYYPNLSDHDAAALAERFAGRAEFENLLLTESNLDQILEKINQHGKDSIVLLTNSFLDRQANLSLLKGKLPAFWQRCNVPVYVVSRTLLELVHPVGGSINSDYPQGKIAADMALRILNGESVSSIPIVRKSPNTYIFNYPQMRRFGIELADLPPGSTVLNQPQSFYYLYKKRIWAVIGIIVGLLILVIMLEVNTFRRKRAEEKLRTKNIAIESSINAIAFADMNGRLTDVNNSFLRMWGYGNGRQVLGKSVTEFWADERKAAQVSETVMNQGSWIGELKAKRKDNSTFDAEVSASLVKDEVGNPVCMMASLIDVTERERAEKALRQSEEKYRLVIENTQDLTYSISPDGTITFISPQVTTLGYSIQGVVGRNISKFIHPDDIQHVMANLAQTLATGEAPSLECRLLKKDGGYIWVEETGSAVHKGDEIVQITGSIRDVTERRRAEEALRESEHRYKTLFEGTAEGIVVADIQTRKFMYASPAFCAMLGYTEDEVKELGVEDIHPREHLQHVLSEFEAQARGEKSLAPDIPCRRKNGEIIYADINTAGVVIDGRKCNVGFFTDITDRKQAEEARRETEEKYRRIVESLRQEYFFYSHGPDGVFDYVSPSIENVLGYSRKEFL